MATKTIGPPRIVKPDATQREVLDNSYRILNGQSWSAGDFLFTQANGLLERCADDQDAAVGGIKFLALEDVSDPENNTTFASVVKLTEDMEFEMNVHHGTSASALAAASIVGLQYNIEHATPAGADSATGHPVVDLSDTGDPAVEVTAVASDYDPSGENLATDVYGLCRVKIVPGNLTATPA